MGSVGAARKVAEELLQGDEPQVLSESGDPEKAWHVALLYSLVGKHAESVRRCEALLPRISAKYGPDDPRTLSHVSDLAYILGYQSRKLGEAIDLLQPAYRRAIRTLGANDHQTLGMMRDLTVFLAMAERNADAARILEEALPALRKAFGAANPHLGPHYINLSESYKLLRRYQDSVNLLEDAIKAIPEKDRANYVNFEFLLNNLMEAYHGLGDAANTRKYATETERWIRARFPADSLQLASGLLMLGEALTDIGLLADAERVLRDGLTIRERQAPSELVLITEAKVRLGLAVLGQKRDAEAEPLLAAGYETLAAHRAKLNSGFEELRVKAGGNLAQLYERTGRPEKAAAIRAQLPP
jgi:hypothetical protein